MSRSAVHNAQGALREGSPGVRWALSAEHGLCGETTTEVSLSSFPVTFPLFLTVCSLSFPLKEPLSLSLGSLQNHN